MKNKYPDTYLHIEECRTGETFIVPLRGNAKLDIKKLVKEWIAQQFYGEFTLDGDLTPKIQGEYYAKIMTDGRPPNSVICWTSGGFYVKPIELSDNQLERSKQ